MKPFEARNNFYTQLLHQEFMFSGKLWDKRDVKPFLAKIHNVKRSDIDRRTPVGRRMIIGFQYLILPPGTSTRVWTKPISINRLDLIKKQIDA